VAREAASGDSAAAPPIKELKSHCLIASPGRGLRTLVQRVCVGSDTGQWMAVWCPLWVTSRHSVQ